MNVLQRWQARTKEQGRIFRLLPDHVQDRYQREEWRLAWWGWLTITIPLLALSIIMAVVVVALAVFFAAVYDSSDPEGGFAGAAPIAEAFPGLLADGLSLVIFGPIYCVLWAVPCALMAHAAKVKWVQRWHREHKTGEVPEAVRNSPLVARVKAWWRALPAE